MLERASVPSRKGTAMYKVVYLPLAEEDILAAVDYIAASKAWDKALRDRDIINMPARPE